MRFVDSTDSGSLSLEDYVKKMKPGQQKIFYVTGGTKDMALNNPFMEPFKEADMPVLLLTN